MKLQSYMIMMNLCISFKKDGAAMDSIMLYWDKRFKENNLIWGKEPSDAAVRTSSLLKKEHLNYQKILDVGCGYGRDSAYFTSHHHKVTGIDISHKGIKIARNCYPDIDFINGSIFELPFPDKSFDMVFGNFLLHLFLKNSRKNVLTESLRVIKPGGIAAFSVASTEDSDFGQGVEKEKNCFVNARGIMKCYFTLNSIQEEFELFDQVYIEQMLEKHIHDYPHEHQSYLVVARKGGL